MLKPLRILLALCVLSSATAASAQPVPKEELAAARESFRAGKKKLEAGDYEGALADYRLADKVVNKPSTRLGVARALAGLGRLVEARKAALSVADMPAPAKEHPTLVKAREDAAALAQQLNGQVARLRFAVTPAEADIFVDSQLLTAAERGGFDIDPGQHTVRVSGAGLLPQEQTIDLQKGATRTVELALQSEADEPAGSGPVFGTVSWIGVGIAGAGLLTGAVAGGITLSRASDIEQNCTEGDDNRDCPEPFHADRSAALTSAHVSTAGFALAGVGVAVGLIGLFVLDQPEPSDEPAESVLVQPLIGPGFVGVQGTF